MKVLVKAFLFLSLWSQGLTAQIQYGIDYDAENEEYQLYLVSEVEMLKAPYNRISTAQISLRAAKGTFRAARSWAKSSIRSFSTRDKGVKALTRFELAKAHSNKQQ